ncbi:MAG TPA: hypothetical protein PKK00_12535 [Bacteroidales bacterium]|nr:hypothetical protein [Bacteroidales bacterium]HPS18059.1 hypothetical protein [Bacteroidales bacterium]
MTAIKTITTLHFDYMQTGAGENFENIKPFKSAYAEYDTDEHPLMEISYSKDGSVEQKCVNKYNTQGKVIEELLYNEDDEIDEKKTYEYNEKCDVLNSKLYYADGSFDITNYLYDENNNLIEKNTVDSDGELESKKVLTYENGKLSSEISTDAEGIVTNKLHIDYDEKGNETKIERYIAVDDKTTRTEIIYNEKDEKSEVLNYVNNKLVSKQLYELNEKEQLVKIEEEEQYSASTTVFTYDERGNMTEQTETNEAGELNSRITRKFNENNKLDEVYVTVDRHGRGINQNYKIQYIYEYF